MACIISLCCRIGSFYLHHFSRDGVEEWSDFPLFFSSIVSLWLGKWVSLDPVDASVIVLIQHLHVHKLPFPAAHSVKSKFVTSVGRLSSFMMFKRQFEQLRWWCIFCHRRHFLQCQQGFLGKHFEKLVQCDPRLNFLSQQPEILLETPYFELRGPPFGDLNESAEVLDSKAEDRPSVFALGDAASPSGGLSSSLNDEHQVFIGRTPESCSQETPSPSTGKTHLSVVKAIYLVWLKKYDLFFFPSWEERNMILKMENMDENSY